MIGSLFRCELVEVVGHFATFEFWSALKTSNFQTFGVLNFGLLVIIHFQTNAINNTPSLTYAFTL